MNRDEIALHTEHADLKDRLAAAKDAARAAIADCGGDGSLANIEHPDVFEELDAAKSAVIGFNEHWRGIRDFFKPEAEPGVATPEHVLASTTSAEDLT